jgi:hypothetical protein
LHASSETARVESVSLIEVLSDELQKLATYSLKPSINLLGSNAGGGEGLVGKGGVDAHVKTEHEEGREGVGDCEFQGQ